MRRIGLWLGVCLAVGYAQAQPPAILPGGEPGLLAPRPEPIDLPKVIIPGPTLTPVGSPDEPMRMPPNPLPLEAPERLELPVIGAKPAEPVDPTSLGRQPSGVTIEWRGLPTARVGRVMNTVLVVKNSTDQPLQKVVVQARITGAADGLAAEPKAEQNGNVLLWEFGTLAGGEEKAIRITLTPSGRGELAMQSWVTSTGTASAKVVVREPKLVVKVRSPEATALGDPVNLTFEVSNPGDAPAERVKVVARLPEGLERLSGGTVEQEIGVLPPGETKTVNVACSAKLAGSHSVEVVAEAADGLKANEVGTVRIVEPKLILKLAGPKQRYIGRPGGYTATLANAGDAVAKNVTVAYAVPAGFQFVRAGENGQYDASTRQVKWLVAEVAPGGSKEMLVDLMAKTPGAAKHLAAAQAAKGARSADEFDSLIEGVAGISMEVRDSADPVAFGGETTYEITVTNTGSLAESELALSCHLSQHLELKAIDGPVARLRDVPADGGFILKPVAASLAPQETLVVKVRVKAIAAGDARFEVRMKASGLGEPVAKEEPTRIYKD